MNEFNHREYPDLAKPKSDGTYCYNVQRRISHRISVRLANYIGPNVATGIDLMLGVAAAAFVTFGYWLIGAVLIQIFGIFSCVDGEIARIQDRSSRIGNFLDTMTDRTMEFLFLAAIAFSLDARIESQLAIIASFALLGGVFLLTVSAEKFRSTFETAYPKKRLERFFSHVSAGSDSRLLVLSIGLVVSDLANQDSLLLWILGVLAAAAYANFIQRIHVVYQHYGDADRAV